ncbi:MAG: OsmC family protein, partial [Phycisphaerae bacterium]|nr:OsmC family protein [Phycisphaerae bacterium]
RDFANTDFSSNVADLVAAARSLEQTHDAPQLLIGHSLGGAAVLMAAEPLPAVTAVATIGAPGDPAHVTHLLSQHLDQIEKHGEATIQLGGRPFTIKRQFIEDLQSQSLAERVSQLDRPLLIFHAPGDRIVGIDNARAIFEAARHPKSFVSLDDADHLVTRSEDARFIADTLAAWARRYLEPAEQEHTPPEGTVVVSEGQAPYTQAIRAGEHVWVSDEPQSIGGGDRGPTPYDLLLSALGSCTAITLRMYADRKQWPLEHVEITLRHERVHADDCDGCEDRNGKIERIQRQVCPVGPLDDDQRQRLLEIADKCPVHRTLTSDIHVATSLMEE